MPTDRDKIRIKFLVEEEAKFLNLTDIKAYTDKILDKAEFFLCKKNGFLCGFVAYYCNNTDTGIAYISMVILDKAYRNKGLGKAMVCGAVKVMKERGFSCCDLEVDKNNTTAINVYRNIGFTFVRHTNNNGLILRLYLGTLK